MKRIIALVTAVVMIIVASPVVIAADLDFSGKVSAQIDYEAEQLAGESEFSLEAALGENLRAGFNLNGLTRPFSGNWDNNGVLSLDNIWLEARGPLFPGTPEMVTRLGGLDVNYSPLIGIVSNNGISVDELGLGPVTLGAFYAWEGTDRIRGARIQLSPVEAMEIQGSLVQASQDYYAVETTVHPWDYLQVTGVYAAEEDGDHAFKVDGRLQLLSDLEIRAGYRNIAAGFAPEYGDPDHGKPDKPHYNPGTEQKGFSVGATLEQMGFVLKGDYAFYDNTLAFSATRPLELAGMNFDTRLEGTYNTDRAELDSLEAGVDYTAPNGVNLSVGYDFVEQQPSAQIGLSLAF